MLLLSIGFTCGTFFSNELMFRSGTTITVPDSAAGSMRSMTFSSAMIDAYFGSVRAGDERQHRPRLRAMGDEHRNAQRGIDAGRNFDRAVGFLTARGGGVADSEGLSFEGCRERKN